MTSSLYAIISETQTKKSYWRNHQVKKYHITRYIHATNCVNNDDNHIDGLVQESTLAMELRLSFANPMIWCDMPAGDGKTEYDQGPDSI